MTLWNFIVLCFDQLFVFDLILSFNPFVCCSSFCSPMLLIMCPPPPSLVRPALFPVCLHLHPPHVCPVVILFKSMHLLCLFHVADSFFVVFWFDLFVFLCGCLVPCLPFCCQFSQLPFYSIVCLILDFSWLKLAFCLTTCLFVCLVPGSFLSNCHSYITTGSNQKPKSWKVKTIGRDLMRNICSINTVKVWTKSAYIEISQKM